MQAVTPNKEIEAKTLDSEDKSLPKYRGRSKKSRGGITTLFPERLYQLLHDAESGQFEGIVGWQAHGRAFMVRDKKRFTNEVLALYFKQSKFASFCRQLALYGFIRLRKNGPDKGAYYHRLCIRGMPKLSAEIHRVPLPQDRNPPAEEPDFSTYPSAPSSGLARDAQKEESLVQAEQLPRTVPSLPMSPMFYSGSISCFPYFQQPQQQQQAVNTNTTCIAPSSWPIPPVLIENVDLNDDDVNSFLADDLSIDTVEPTIFDLVSDSRNQCEVLPPPAVIISSPCSELARNNRSVPRRVSTDGIDNNGRLSDSPQPTHCDSPENLKKKKKLAMHRKEIQEVLSMSLPAAAELAEVFDAELKN